MVADHGWSRIADSRGWSRITGSVTNRGFSPMVADHRLGAESRILADGRGSSARSRVTAIAAAAPAWRASRINPVDAFRCDGSNDPLDLLLCKDSSPAYTAARGQH
jgi:hypothetical protein